MSRRDTIIIAVLVNAGLLVVLFVTALKSNTPEQELAANPAKPVQTVSELPLKKEILASGDEVDQALSQFSEQKALTPAMTAQPAALAAAPATASANFADDLKAITQPSTAMTDPMPLTPLAAEPAPAPLLPPSDTAKSALAEVVVKKGDFLEKIARTNGTTVEDIMKANALPNTRLKIGQVLKLPIKSTSLAKKTAPSTTSPAPTATPKYYTVKNGDNPWTIAVKNHMKVDELLKLNNLNDEKARRLKPGDQLRIK